MKKIVKISGIVACAAVLFFNVSLSGKKNSNSIDLASVTKISEANAECIGYDQWYGGHCSGGFICVQDSWVHDCDPRF